MEIRININGTCFYASWIRQGSTNIFRYERFVVRSNDATKCMPFLIGYIKLHQEFIKPNGVAELKTTLEEIVGRICTPDLAEK
jgi:hypothetical protein